MPGLALLAGTLKSLLALGLITTASSLFPVVSLPGSLLCRLLQEVLPAHRDCQLYTHSTDTVDRGGHPEAQDKLLLLCFLPDCPSPVEVSPGLHLFRDMHFIHQAQERPGHILYHSQKCWRRCISATGVKGVGCHHIL